MQKILIALTALIALNLPHHALANSCGGWQSKVKATQRNINKGGNQSQVRQWIKERNYYASELEKCNKKNGTHRWIETSGSNNKSPQRQAREKLRAINTDNPQLQQMIATCNFWIDQHNQNATADNRTFKNTACANADSFEKNIQATHDNTAAVNPAPATLETPAPKRSLKECVKPNNRIDDDVKRCMQGYLEPEWILNR